MSYELTLVEAQDLMLTATGESWSLPRLIRAGARVAVWLEPPPNATRALIDAVFLGSEAGFVAQVVEGGDLKRLAFTRGDGSLTFARRPDGQVVRMSPPARFGPDELRFDADDLRALAARVGVAPAPIPPTTSGDRKRWTPEQLDDLRMYREQHGTEKAADYFGISTSRVRALLPGDTTAKKPYSVFNQGK